MDAEQEISKLHTRIEDNSKQINKIHLDLNNQIRDTIAITNTHISDIKKDVSLMAQKFDGFLRPCSDLSIHCKNHPEPKDIENHLNEDKENKKIKKTAFFSSSMRMIFNVINFLLVSFLTYILIKSGLK